MAWLLLHQNHQVFKANYYGVLRELTHLNFCLYGIKVTCDVNLFVVALTMLRGLVELEEKSLARTSLMPTSWQIVQ